MRKKRDLGRLPAPAATGLPVGEEAGDPLLAALSDGDPATLLMVLVQLTGDENLLDEARGHIRGPWDYSVDMPENLQARIRDGIRAALSPSPGAAGQGPRRPDNRLLRKMMEVVVGEPVGEAYIPMMLEEMGLTEGADPRGLQWRSKPPARVLEGFHVVVIGAGMSGLCAGMRLKEAGIAFTILEKNETVGGTWFENAYPGCGVDTPNHFYSYSFAPNHDWSHFFSKRDTLWRYFEDCADRFGLRPHIRFRREVLAAAFDEDAQLWRLTVRAAAGGEERITANAIICAVGQLNCPSVPEIPGLETFDGPAFHTARWPQDLDLAGRRVAMIGTGASGMQVGPSIAPAVEHLAIFQRSPHWVVPNPNYHRAVAPGKKLLLEQLPHYGAWYRFQLFWGFADGIHAALQRDPDWPDPATSLNAVNEKHRRFMLRHARKVLQDTRPDLLHKVIPDYPPYGKRILIDNHWFETLLRPNVDLVTEAIERVDRHAVVTADGQAHPCDAIVLATGFHARRMLWPMRISGRGGVRLSDIWGEEDPRAYLGVTVPRFPNLFILYGPNTNLGHGGSAIFHTECQMRYALRCLRELLEEGHRSIEVRQEVHDAYNRRVDEAHARMVWTHPGMRNWYRNDKGRVFANSPWRLVDYWAMTAELKPAEYLAT